MIDPNERQELLAGAMKEVLRSALARGDKLMAEATRLALAELRTDASPYELPRLYHYTDRLSAADIRRAGVIRAQPLTLHRDMFAKDKGIETGPLVWLTVDASSEGTVVGKMLANGWPSALVGDLWRFVMPGDYPTQSLGDYIEAAGMDPAWWKWAVRTGMMAGSDCATWRLAIVDIPAADWLAVEVLAEMRDDGEMIWRPFA